MSDSGRQIGDCKHGWIKERCDECKEEDNRAYFIQTNAVAIVEELERRIERYKREVAKLQESRKDLRKEVERLKEAAQEGGRTLVSKPGAVIECYEGAVDKVAQEAISRALDGATEAIRNFQNYQKAKARAVWRKTLEAIAWTVVWCLGACGFAVGVAELVRWCVGGR